ncbi:hypothetical protein B0H11DRAFT_1935433 [Mycena galericulata]|nr:hypothetical protein B0H11DRAFT_1935433 [Mycena galericulata]
MHGTCDRSELTIAPQKLDRQTWGGKTGIEYNIGISIRNRHSLSTNALDFHLTRGNVSGEQAVFVHGELGHLQQPAMKHRGCVFHSRVRKIHLHDLFRKASLDVPGTVGSSFLDNFFRVLDLGREAMELRRRELKVDSARDRSANDNREEFSETAVIVSSSLLDDGDWIVFYAASFERGGAVVLLGSSTYGAEDQRYYVQESWTDRRHW